MFCFSGTDRNACNINATSVIHGHLSLTSVPERTPGNTRFSYAFAYIFWLYYQVCGYVVNELLPVIAVIQISLQGVKHCLRLSQ